MCQRRMLVPLDDASRFFLHVRFENYVYSGHRLDIHEVGFSRVSVLRWPDEDDLKHTSSHSEHHIPRVHLASVGNYVNRTRCLETLEQHQVHATACAILDCINRV